MCVCVFRCVSARKTYSSALAMELRFSCRKPSIYKVYDTIHYAVRSIQIEKHTRYHVQYHPAICGLIPPFQHHLATSLTMGIYNNTEQNIEDTFAHRYQAGIDFLYTHSNHFIFDMELCLMKIVKLFIESLAWYRRIYRKINIFKWRIQVLCLMEHHFTIFRIAGTSTLEINFISYYFKCHILQMRSSSIMLIYLTTSFSCGSIPDLIWANSDC